MLIVEEQAERFAGVENRPIQPRARQGRARPSTDFGQVIGKQCLGRLTRHAKLLRVDGGEGPARHSMSDYGRGRRAPGHSHPSENLIESARE